ncbi:MULTISPECIES: bifunctional lytic transglycosylase/C40 family peptidase [unclassified Streptomyces]|uniref:C40 family peptidase n=1 Tax=unclassified Streptomyces TaxID=2593676 RepID=UPI002DD7A1CE|nr:bifunctional lytic transglycosylase/C40 family peptidase [Streptomyces sp. NBC_01795]WSA97751.1 NlpC/P60 family protein [Streptomyces sp. NBC_01795]WSS46732.1 NlpC/P60 family protein [Streptomyces sp. NBC_01187]WSS47051.1 NlpC/P60 family protein [Streptomyces sp. NBC_01187]
MKRLRRWGCVTVLGALVFVVLPLGVMAAASRQNPDELAGQIAAISGVPAPMLAAYQQAAFQFHEQRPKVKGLDWAILAGIAKVESGHAGGHRLGGDGTLAKPILGPRLVGDGTGGNTSRHADTDGGRFDGDASVERAVGPFQFMPGTWAHSGKDGNGDGRKDPQNIHDAALSAAWYLGGDGRDLSKPGQLHAALMSYNHSEAYVQEVTGWIHRYRSLAARAGSGATVSGSAGKVIKAARKEIGTPYSWGGGSAQGPSRGVCCSPGGKSGTSITGYDCSGLTQYAYAKAGVRLPRLASDQASVGKRIPRSKGVGALRPGDLVFFAYNPSRDSTINHVGIYLGGGEMLNAPRPGAKVRTEQVRSDGFAGGARVL